MKRAYILYYSTQELHGNKPCYWLSIAPGCCSFLLEHIERITGSVNRCVRKFKEQVADWERFQILLQPSFSSTAHLGIAELQSLITLHIIEAAEKSILRTPSRTKHGGHGGTPSVRVPMIRRRHGLNSVGVLLLITLYILSVPMKTAGTSDRKPNSKAGSHFFYLLTLIQMRKVYNKVRALEGHNMLPVPLVSTVVVKLEHQADAIGQDFEYVLSSAHYTDSFMHHKLVEEQKPVRDGSMGGYNSPVTVEGLKGVLGACGCSAAGPGRITYGTLKHLHKHTFETLLFLLNKIRSSGVYTKPGKRRL